MAEYLTGLTIEIRQQNISLEISEQDFSLCETWPFVRHDFDNQSCSSGLHWSHRSHVVAASWVNLLDWLQNVW